MSYARGTSVPVERSRAELERVITKAGADQYSAGWAKNKAVVMFRMNGRYIRIEMPLPQIDRGRFNSTDKVAQETRRRWRGLILYVKAKVESVESGIVSFEQAFMAHIVLPNRQTVGEFMAPQIESAYGSGQMPKLLEYGK